MKDEWVEDWFGYKRHISTIQEPEQPCKEEVEWFKKIVAELQNREKVILYEIGSGYGPWAMALAALRKEKDYECIEVEANPEYVKLTEKHLYEQQVKYQIFNYAISDKNGYCRFNRNFIPFGQEITFSGRIKGSRILGILWGIMHILTKNTIKVRTLNIDYLAERIHQEHIDILQMDIQGTEIKAIKGAKNEIYSQLISYIIIGTHHKNINQELQKILSPNYNLLNNTLPTKGKDGLQVWKIKSLDKVNS